MSLTPNSSHTRKDVHTWMTGIAAKTGACALLLLVWLGCLALYASPSAHAEGPGLLIAAHEHAQQGTAGSDSALLKENIEAGVMYAVRIVYYMALLFAAGMMLLRLMIPQGDRGAVQRRWLDKWSGTAVKTLLAVSILYVFMQAARVVRELGGGGDLWLRVFTETASGQLWLALIVLSLLGTAAVKLPDVGKAAWALLLLATESFGGHAAASEQATLSILSDFVHLACAALWAGGVILLLLFWRVDRKEAGRFAERFSSVAWLAIVILTLSGVVMTWTLIPSWLYLLYTDWGLWLLAKTSLVIGVAAVGAVLRYRAKRRELPRGVWLKLDGLLMALIIGIAAIFTAISPMPDGKPLNHHQMGENLHYTLKVSPNAPGPNDASLTVWLPEDAGEPQTVALSLRYENKPAIEVTLERSETEGGIAFPGFNEYRFRAEGVVLPRPGNWTAVITITQASGETLEREFPFATH
ncbi:copper resistance protein CopC [Paenibacillus sp. 1011MAR3C5]|uniref:copper resistance D family protein n=1 Tax=Paenibacillus sp. 1011MAR3C5 TaxID=1675787 RepID=UPI000E6B9EC3|nr:CopD family protein [Paenibacillus sp. 1011MAR3C5]RJE91197.1 copper resistance protein CopC [Paenibacillus sp. 1011MAR3C5]